MANPNDFRLKSQRYNHTLLKKQLQMIQVLKLTRAKNRETSFPTLN